jgi:hypothetical protein
MAEQLEWHDPTPSSSSTSLASGASFTPSVGKKHRHTEEDDDPTYNPRDEGQSAWSPNRDKEVRDEVLAGAHTLFASFNKVCESINASFEPQQLVEDPVMEEEEVAPAPSTATSMMKASGKPKLRRGEHGRH